jgi:hypothetical protein
MIFCNRFTRPGLLAGVLLLGLAAPAGAGYTQFDFNTGDLSATFGPGILSYFQNASAADVQFGTASSFGIAALPGGNAGVMRFPAFAPDKGLFLKTAAPPNGGGAYINQFTMVWDMLVPNVSANWLSFFNSNDANANDGDFFIRNSDGGIGISGDYQGKVNSGQWHRIAASFDLTGPTLSKYIDGILVGSQTLSAGVDGRWSLYSANDPLDGVLILADNDGDMNPGYLNSFLFVDRAMTLTEIAALGGPNAIGIIPEPSSGLLLLASGAGWLLWRRRG